jgi:uncharacterized protein (DUF1800 family)
MPWDTNWGFAIALTSHLMQRHSRHVRTPFIVTLLLGALGAPLAAQSMSGTDSATHALNRLAFGPRPGDAERVARQGVMRWIDAQLDPQGIPDDALAVRERAFQINTLELRDLAQRFVQARRERIARQRNAGPDSMRMAEEPRPGELLGLRRLGGELQQLAVLRASMSERQLYEVMVDFWTNHFNVYFAKGADRFLLPSYIERTIRPLALGRFEDLLIATARSPAMLFYLDNAQSVAPGSRPPQLDRLERFRRIGPRADSMAQRLEARMPRGINENYARELLELHTLGVDGGYTQKDVQEVARVFTGWGIERPLDGAGFSFREWAHDGGDKTVLGVRVAGNRGMQEGIDVLKLLAQHHATMHHISAKLCARFVADDPPDGCVDDAVAAWHESDGDIRAVLRAIFHSPDFWSARAVRAKVKTPLEFVVSAVRAVGAVPDTSLRLAQIVGRLGQPLFLQSAPTGYPETQADWVNSGALLQRMNFAVGLASGRGPGATVDLTGVLPTGNVELLIHAVNDRLLGGAMSEQTKKVLRRELADVQNPEQMRALAVGLALGGPEFQRQ